MTYDPESGKFFRIKPRGGSKEGEEVGTNPPSGYQRISIDAKLYLASRLAYLYMLGEMPKGNIDHKDGNPRNNSWNNLRVCTQKQNTHNQKGHGEYYKNVYYTKGGRNKPFNVKIEINGVSKSFGYYRTPEEADEAASLIRDMLHGEFSISNRKQ